MTELGEKWPVNLACDSDFHVNRRDLLHAANLRHGTDGFTSPPKEGMLWNFFARKIRRLRPVSNRRYWVPEDSMLTTRPPKLCPHSILRITYVSIRCVYEIYTVCVWNIHTRKEHNRSAVSVSCRKLINRLRLYLWAPHIARAATRS
jgi:hypothetical protein